MYLSLVNRLETTGVIDTQKKSSPSMRYKYT